MNPTGNYQLATKEDHLWQLATINWQQMRFVAIYGNWQLETKEEYLWPFN